MAWKFDNPWGGSNAQNPWDIQGEEAEKALGLGEEAEKALGLMDENKDLEKMDGIGKTKGVFIYGLSNEEQIKIFTSKIQELVPSLKLKYEFGASTYSKQKNKGEDNILDYKGLIYMENGSINPLNPIQKIIYYFMNNTVRLKNDTTLLSSYERFNGNNYQLINIDNYNITYDEYFMYAVTHAFREYLWAVNLAITEEAVKADFKKEYDKAHGRTLIQDLEVYSYFAKMKNPEWSWWEDLNKYKYLQGFSSLINVGTRICRSEADTQQNTAIYLVDVDGGSLTPPSKIVSIKFINIQSWEAASNNMDKVVTYDEVFF